METDWNKRIEEHREKKANGEYTPEEMQELEAMRKFLDETAPVEIIGAVFSTKDK